MITRRNAIKAAPVAIALVAAPAWAESSELPRQAIKLVASPFVHTRHQFTDEGPKINEFRLVIEEKGTVINDEGMKLRAMTFNGSTHGPMLVVHEGDYVEVTLVNPKANWMSHNIDFHATVGGTGGAILRPGLFAPAPPAQRFIGFNNPALHRARTTV